MLLESYSPAKAFSMAIRCAILPLIAATLCFFAGVRALAAAEPQIISTSQPPLAGHLMLIDEQKLQFAIEAQPTDARQSKGKAATLDLPLDAFVRYGAVVEPRPRSRQALVLFRDGSQIIGRVEALGRDVLELSTQRLGAIEIPRSRVIAILAQAPLDIRERDLRIAELLAANGDEDRLTFENGDELRGEVRRWEANPKDAAADPQIAFATAAGEVPIDVTRIQAIRFSRSEKPFVARGPRMWVGLSDGSIVLAAKVVGASGNVSIVPFDLAVHTGDAWSVRSLTQITFLQSLGRRVTYLSDLQPMQQRQVPLLGDQRPLRSDRNVLGQTLRSQRERYLKGLGLAPASVVVYPIGSAKKFTAELAIDAAAGFGGSITCQVLVDGQSKYASPLVRGGDAPLPISIDVAGGRTLSIVVLFADHGDVQDYANLFDARLEE